MVRFFSSRRAAVRSRNHTAVHRRGTFEELEQRNLLAVLYVDPNGLGGTPGGSTFTSFQTAWSNVQPGDTIILRNGTYPLTDLPYMTSGGTANAPITIQAAAGERPILDMAERYPVGPGGWQQDPRGFWYVDLPANSIAKSYAPTLSVEVRNGWAASQVLGDPLNGGPPANFLNPPDVYLQNGLLAYDLTWYDPALGRLWVRPNQFDPPGTVNPATDYGVVSPASQFHASGASWLTFDGLTMTNGWFGIHLDSGQGWTVRNCTVLDCYNQGMAIYGSGVTIERNFVDKIAGVITDKGASGIRRDWLNHCLYLDAADTVVDGNFFGRTKSGNSVDIMGTGTASSPLTFRNNYCYGGAMDALVAEGSNVVVSNNLLVNGPLWWRGGVPTGMAAGDSKGVYLLPTANISLANNYIEGLFGMYYNDGNTAAPGISIVNNRITGATADLAMLSTSSFAALDGNIWCGATRFFMIPGANMPSINYPAFLAWAQGQGFEQQSASQTWSPTGGPIFDQQLDAGMTVDQAIAMLQSYVAGQTSPPQATTDTYWFHPNTTLAVDKGHGVLANDSDPDGDTLTAQVLSAPAHGTLTLNADGSFQYTPAAGFTGTDSFTYLASDGAGGAAATTVTLVDPPAPTALPVTAVEGASSGSQVVATFTDGGVAGTYSATIDWGDGSTTPGTITAASSGTYSVSGAHTYANDGSYAISVAIQDAGGIPVVATTTATVADPSVVPSAGPAISAIKGTSTGIVVLATFTDPGGLEAANNYAATINWGDGTPLDTGTLVATTGGYLVEGSHVYTQASTANSPYAVTVAIQHGSATDASTSTTAAVADPVVSGPAGVVTATTANLSVLGLDPGMAASLVYTWSMVSGPLGPAFSDSNSYTAQNTMATFSAAGNYVLRATMTGPNGLSFSRDVSVAVGQTLTTLSISAPPAALVNGATYQIAATATDQFHAAMTVAPTWSITTAGVGGTVGAGGLYTAPATGAGTDIVQASVGALTSTAAMPVQVGIFTNALDIGAVGLHGSAGFASATSSYTVKGSGNDIWGTTDKFQFAFRNTTGDATLVAQVTAVQNTNSSAKAGVMFRAGTAANAPFVDLVVTPGAGISFQYRTAVGGTSSGTTVSGKAPRWVKLIRSGNTFTGYTSSDGVRWSTVGTKTVTMPATTQTGLAVTAHNNTAICAATFGNVSLTTSSGAVLKAAAVTAGPSATTTSTTVFAPATLPTARKPTKPVDLVLQAQRSWLPL